MFDLLQVCVGAGHRVVVLSSGVFGRIEEDSKLSNLQGQGSLRLNEASHVLSDRRKSVRSNYID